MFTLPDKSGIALTGKTGFGGYISEILSEKDMFDFR